MFQHFFSLFSCIFLAIFVTIVLTLGMKGKKKFKHGRDNIGLSLYLLHLHISCVYSNIQWWLLSQEHFSNVWHSLISSISVAHIKYVLEAMSGSCLGMWPLTSKNLSKCSNIGDKYYSINHWKKFPCAFQEHLICMTISLRPLKKKRDITPTPYKSGSNLIPIWKIK